MWLAINRELTRRASADSGTCSTTRISKWQWDNTEGHVIWLIAISNTSLVARAAYDAAVKWSPRERWLLRGRHMSHPPPAACSLRIRCTLPPTVEMVGTPRVSGH